MTSTGSGDPARRLADYYPAWLDNLADDVTLEGSMMDGLVQGSEAVRTVLVHIRSLYDYQQFHAVGPFSDNGWFEDYTAGVRGEPIKTSPWSPVTPPGGRSTSWATTGLGAHCCSCPG
jgi:hypothetical protein